MDEQNETTVGKKSQNNSLFAIVGIIVIVVVGIIGYKSMHKSDSQTATTTQQTAQTTAQTPTQAATGSATAAKYKDGTYTAVGDYVSPGGQQQLGVTLTNANGVVKDSQVVEKAADPVSKGHQEDLIANYKTMVVGKNLADLQLGKVSGSSLSPKGFNDAVDKIKAEAKS